MAEMGPRAMAEGLAGRLFDRSVRRSERQVGAILIYHEIAPVAGDWSREVIPAVATDHFRAQLEHLERRCEVVPLKELIARAGGRARGGRVPVALTFDDDLACYDSIVAPLLRELGLPATFFLNGSTLEGPRAYWWQDLQTIVDRDSGSLESLRREMSGSWPWAALDGGVHDLADTIESLPSDEHDAVAERLRELAGPDAVQPGLPAEAVKRIAAAGFEIGFHTRDHVLMPPLDDAALADAVERGVAEIEATIGYRPTTISYPYGKANLRVAEAARRAGFELGMAGGHGATGTGQHPMLLTRFSPGSESIPSFARNLARATMRG